MKFGALKQDEYFEQGGDLYQKLSDGMKGKKALHIKSKQTVNIPLLSLVIRASAPPPRIARPRPPKSDPVIHDYSRTIGDQAKDQDKIQESKPEDSDS